MPSRKSEAQKLYERVMNKAHRDKAVQWINFVRHSGEPFIVWLHTRERSMQAEKPPTDLFPQVMEYLNSLENMLGLEEFTPDLDEAGRKKRTESLSRILGTLRWIVYKGRLYNLSTTDETILLQDVTDLLV